VSQVMAVIPGAGYAERVTPWGRQGIQGPFIG